MAPSIRFQDLTREALSALAPEALLILPLGATEQHGPHLPVGTDAFAVNHIAQAAAQRIADDISVLVAPVVPFGSSHHHIPFGGTLSLSTETYYHVLRDLLESLVAGGFRRIFMLNGHGGNHELAQLAARDVALAKEAHIAAASYWDVAWEALLQKDAHLTQKLPGHAGGFETSLIMALHPELVAAARPRRDDPSGSAPEGRQPVRVELHGSWQRIDGYSDSPDRGDEANGKAYLAAIIEAVAEAFKAFESSTRSVE